MNREPVAVIVPFKGAESDAERVISQLRGLSVDPGDELVVVDNCPQPVVQETTGITVVRAADMASSYYARNAGAAATSAQWLLFVDSDCLLPVSLIDDYFGEQAGPTAAVVAGELDAAPGQTALTARYERSRGHLGVAQHLDIGPGPAGITANLLVRRSAWQALGGFAEVRSGADLDFCWRAGAEGLEVAYEPKARVQHLHTESIGAMVRKSRRYGPGQAWLERRFPGSSPPPRIVGQIARAVVGSILWPLRGQFERGLFKALDGVWSVAYWVGYRFGGNDPDRLSRP